MKAEADRAAETSARFVAAIEAERAWSVTTALSNGALHNPVLTCPSLVDMAWEREVAKARP